MDWMTPLGYLIGLGTVGYVLVSGNAVGLIFNLHAIILVYGGTLGATLLSYPQSVLIQSIRALRIFLFPGARPGANVLIQILMRLSDKARRQGVDSLAPDLDQIGISFLSHGLRMVMDGLPAEMVRSNLIKEIRFSRDRHMQTANVFRSAAAYAPIFGLLGTLVGVVQVLMTLTDPKTIGSSMAIAMTATFYGIFGANFIFLPIAGKLNVYAQEEVFLEELMIEGILSIQQNEVPALAARKLQSFAEAHKWDQIQPGRGGGPAGQRTA
ncbi:MAG: MotA/TolQ/ExbB proton channel family protein [Elusimicrobiota bacterium]|jgi:chemotaxis protein MotA